MSRSTSYPEALATFVAGAMVGAGVALLLSPTLAQEGSARLRQVMKDAPEKVRDFTERLVDRGRAAVAAAADAAAEATAETQRGGPA